MLIRSLILKTKSCQALQMFCILSKQSFNYLGPTLDSHGWGYPFPNSQNVGDIMCMWHHHANKSKLWRSDFLDIFVQVKILHVNEQFHLPHAPVINW